MGKIKDMIISNSLIVLGCAIVAIGLNLFIIPNGIASGGLTGIGLLLNYNLGWSIGLFLFISNIPLIVAGGIIWKLKFVTKTLLGVSASSLFIDLFSGLHFTVDNLLLPAIYGGLLTGLGVGIVIRNGATMGGSDILGRIFNKYFGISLGSFYLFFDACVLGAVALIYGLTIALYSMVSVFISSKVVDSVVVGLDKGKQALIISQKPLEIVQFIKDEMNSGLTIINGHGGYAYEDREMILCIVKRWEIFKLKKGVIKIDPLAFIVINDVHEILGLGFKQE